MITETVLPIVWFKSSGHFYLSGYTIDNDRCVVKIPDVRTKVYIEVEERFHNESSLQMLMEKLKGYDVSLTIKKESFSLFGRLPMYCFEALTRGLGIDILRKLSNSREIFRMKIHELDFDELLRYTSDLGITTCSWISITGELKRTIRGTTKVLVASKITRIEEETTTTIKPKILVFDIECEQIDDSIQTNLIFQISIFVSFNKIYLLSIYPVNPMKLRSKKRGINDVTAIILENEEKLLDKFFELIIEEDPDILTGYNILQYDWKVIMETAEKYDSTKNYLSRLGRCGVMGRKVMKEWESTIYGKKDLCYPEIEGRCSIDLYQLITREYRMKSTLDNVASVFLNERKLDIDYKLLFIFSRLCRDSSNDIEITLRPYEGYHKIVARTLESKDLIYPMTKIGKYCIIDSYLVFKLFDKLQVFERTRELAKISNISIDEVYSRGNTHRVLSLIFTESRKSNIIMNEVEGVFKRVNDEMTGKYSGAIVLDPLIGLHDNVICLDFNSLYPNIIINNNLCFTTFIPSEYHQNQQVREFNTTSGVYKFSKDHRGLLPTICARLIDERNKVKKLRDQCDKSSIEYINLHTRQEVLKITVNSIYGFLGTKQGKRRLTPAALVVTQIGQMLLKEARDYIESKGLIVIYGDTDSTMVKLPYDPRNYDINHVMSYDDDTLKALYPESILHESNFFEKRLKTVGYTLARNVTDYINTKYESAYNVGFENLYSKYFLTDKKCYYAKLLNSENIVHKGGVSVKRNYPEIAKRIFDAVLNAIFNGEDIINVYIQEARKTMIETNIHLFISSAPFKEFISYAKKIADVLLDKDDNPIDGQVEDDDDRLVFRKNHGISLAKKMSSRQEKVPFYSRIDYVYIEIPDQPKIKSKSDAVEEYRHFFNNMKFLKLNRIMYLESLEEPLLKLLVSMKYDIHKKKLLIPEFLRKYYKQNRISITVFPRKQFNVISKINYQFALHASTVNMIKKIIIAFEGPDGSGKSTQAILLSSRLGVPVFKYPSTVTTAGKQIYEYLNNKLEFTNEELYSLFLKDKFQSMVKLPNSKVIIYDRYITSGMIYGMARNVACIKREMDLPAPDITFVLEYIKQTGSDRFDTDTELQKTVRELYKDDSNIYSKNAYRINCNTAQETHNKVYSIVSTYLRHYGYQ